MILHPISRKVADPTTGLLTFDWERKLADMIDALNLFGFGAGSGGSVTQATSKSTGVTLNTRCGQIVTHNAALASLAAVSFTVTDSQVAATDAVIVNHASGGTAGAYVVQANAIAAGSFKVTLLNASGGPLSEALTLNFVVVKASAT